MLDYFCIFTKGGALLWTWQLTALRGSPVEALIRTCLLEERSGERSYSYRPPAGAAYTLKWSFDNSLGLVFVAVYQSALKLLYVEELLGGAKAAFARHYQPKCYDYAGFETAFRRELERAEARDLGRQPPAQRQAPAGAGGLTQRKGGRRAGAGGGDGSQPASSEDSEEAGTTDASRQTSRQPSAADFAALAVSADEGQAGGGSPPGEPADGAFDVSRIRGKLAKRPPKGVGAAKKEKAAKDAAKEKEGKKPKKVARKWGAGGSDKEEGPLDFSERPEGASGSEAEGAGAGADLSKASLVDAADDSGSESEAELAQAAAPGQAGQQADGGGGGGFLASWVRGISVGLKGKAALEPADIAPALEQLKRKLMERNVAEAIAARLCESVASTLVGQRLESFSSVAGKVWAAVEAAITRILTPRRSIDILREVQAARARGKPYTIVFVGVNGVGKSTNLSKVAYWLLQNDVKVMIAACDTFRSGAVEQLKTHCNRLGIPLYERGYEKDPAKVAHEAALQAARSKIDVLLVDTAGRMQDNEPLMRALSNLIALNEPELVLFVGEALVGNDAVDQLTKFNQRLLDLARGPKAHAIDGILLTKFDTIDDKVGAALSMVYASGAPIMFVGCGQTYVDLKRLPVKSVVRSLLK